MVYGQLAIFLVSSLCRNFLRMKGAMLLLTVIMLVMALAPVFERSPTFVRALIAIAIATPSTTAPNGPSMPKLTALIAVTSIF